jgi:hypothetical protein
VTSSERRNLLADEIGACYDADPVASMLNVDQATLAEWVQERRVLGMVTAPPEPVLVFPAFQFTGRLLRQDVAEVLSWFRRAQVSEWNLALWFVSDVPDLDNVSPLDYLDQIGVDERLRDYATTHVRAWSR